MGASCYVYAIVRHHDGRPFELPVDGLGGAPVEELACQDVAALTSAYEGAGRVRSSRANLSSHEGVVEAARTSGLGTVLPMRFGVTMPDRRAVVNEYLKPNRLRLSLLLAELAGKTEYRLKATYLPDVALREVVSSSGRIQRLQNEIRRRPDNATYHARIELGELVAAALENVKARDARDILNRVVHYCVSSDVLVTRGDDVALRVALLVDEARLDDFHRHVDLLADELAGRLRLELTGPLAPWDFVDMDPAGW